MRNEWQVERIAYRHYAIFHREVNIEWTDEHGDNLCFETAAQAHRYLNDQFKNLGGLNANT